MLRQRKDPDVMRAQEQLLSVLGLADRVQFFNIAALRRVLPKLEIEAK